MCFFLSRYLDKQKYQIKASHFANNMMASSTFFIPIMILTGVILNLLTIMVFCRHRMRKYCFSLSMICLALSDISVLVIPVLLTWVDEYIYNNYYINNTIWCNLHVYMDLIFSANSSWIIILISTERWFAIYRPFSKPRIFTNVRVTWALIILFILSLFTFIALPLSIHLKSDKLTNKTECEIKFPNQYKVFGVASITLTYVVPSVILAILNIMIIIRLRDRSLHSTSIKARHRQREQLQSGNEFSMDESPDINAKISTRSEASKSKSIRNLSQKNDRNLSISLVILAIVFMILTFPFQGFWFYENFDFHAPHEE